MMPPEPVLTWPELATGAAGLLTAVALLLAGLAWWVRQVVRREAAPARETVRQLATSNGHTPGELLETTAKQVTQLRAMADANRVRIDALDARLDRHIIAGHRAE